MVDARLVELAGRQHNRFSREQAEAIGYTPSALKHRIATGRVVAVHENVFAFPPVMPDEDGRRMGAVLTTPGSVLSLASAGAGWRFRAHHAAFEVVTRRGNGGPRRLDGVLVLYSRRLDIADVTVLRGIPITTGARTLLDLAPHLGDRELARCLREALRLQATTEEELATTLARHRGRRGVARLRRLIEAYRGLPIHRARSDAESLALAILRTAGLPMPDVNRKVAGIEADLSWPAHRLIVEIDGPQFHLDAGEDARRQAIWEAAGWRVERLGSGDVYDLPDRLRALAPRP